MAQPVQIVENDHQPAQSGCSLQELREQSAELLVVLHRLKLQPEVLDDVAGQMVQYVRGCVCSTERSCGTGNRQRDSLSSTGPIQPSGTEWSI